MDIWDSIKILLKDFENRANYDIKKIHNIWRSKKGWTNYEDLFNKTQ